VVCSVKCLYVDNVVFHSDPSVVLPKRHNMLSNYNTLTIETLSDSGSIPASDQKLGIAIA
jgi:hypothetical protein